MQSVTVSMETIVTTIPQIRFRASSTELELGTTHLKGWFIMAGTGNLFRYRKLEV